MDMFVSLRVCVCVCVCEREREREREGEREKEKSDKMNSCYVEHVPYDVIENLFYMMSYRTCSLLYTMTIEGLRGR